MSYRHILHPLAQQEYEEAVEWHAAKSIKAAENLILEIERGLQLICDNPDRWRNEYKDYRELGVKKYPYVIIYTVEEDKYLVIITAIFHTSRNPKKKYRKI
ncbi:type II toxin-antitoxin system RelE/ParE family toxin [Terrimonas pollutisoli]|uniref:type II toxin-antitoxin system RelE/ParE family toxin n=1 Tax=Terrimonas pollutisoli TaxID=3034147 RepID=UPI0023ECF1F3|nr:type II toxin-antitoxin system RelE/ParE family toxin [Terrimonas sp. H1YJ31]